jgi:aldehyde dehydrogenase (NAD+)
MSEEIFGPVLPVLPYDDLGDVLETLRHQPTPLALYLHTKQRPVEQRVLAETRSGGACVNDHIVHVTVHDLPFGGSGASGMGRYHGRSGFDTFSQQRAVMRQAWFWDNPLRYPPGATKLPLIKRLIG